jgi:hypothetical protein
VRWIIETAVSLTPNIFDIARIERLLKSMNSKLGTMESIMISNDEEMRESENEMAKGGHYEECLTDLEDNNNA